MDMDDEEPEDLSINSVIKGEPTATGDSADAEMERLVVKAEQTEGNEDEGGFEDAQEGEDISQSEAYGGFHPSSAQRDGALDALSPRSRHSASLAARFGGRVGSSESVSKTTLTQPAYGLSTPSNSAPSSTTLPRNGFNFNAYTPRQGTPAAFFSGTRTPEEVHADDGMPQMDGAGSPRPQSDAERGVITLD